MAVVGSNKVAFGHAGGGGNGDNNVVKYMHVNQRQRTLERLGQLFVGARGLGVTARVVVGEDHSGGVELKGALDHFARVDAGLRQSASKHNFEGNDPMSNVQEEYGKLLMLGICKSKLQVVLDGLRRDQHRAGLKPAGQDAEGVGNNAVFKSGDGFGSWVMGGVRDWGRDLAVARRVFAAGGGGLGDGGVRHDVGVGVS